MSIVLPPPPVRRLTPAEAASIAKRGRQLLRAGRLTHHQAVLLDALLWSCRSPTTGAIVASYTALQRLGRMARQTVADGLRALEAAGLLSRVKRRVRVSWHQGGQCVRQAANAYLLHPTHCESAGRTVIQKIEILQELPVAAVRAAQDALAAIAGRRRESLLTGGARVGQKSPC